MSFLSVSYYKNKNINQNSPIKIIVKTFTKLYNKKQIIHTNQCIKISKKAKVIMIKSKLWLNKTSCVPHLMYCLSLLFEVLYNTMYSVSNWFPRKVKSSKGKTSWVESKNYDICR